MCVFVGSRRDEQRETEKRREHARRRKRERERIMRVMGKKEMDRCDGRRKNERMKRKQRKKEEEGIETETQKTLAAKQMGRTIDRKNNAQRAAEEHSRHREPASEKQGTRMEELESSSSCTRQLRESERERDIQGDGNRSQQRKAVIVLTTAVHRASV
jgi:hypothetical protein